MTDDERWQANERQLDRIQRMTGLDRELHAQRELEWLDEQDRLEWLAGFDSPTDADSRRWLGLR